jgi:oligo-1,6-glucosidase
VLYLENHDHPRVISRYGSEKFWKESGKMLAVSYLFQQGTPFVYQGQEIGMLNWRPEDPEMYEDVQTRWQYENVGTKKSPRKRLERLWRASRDSARTPVQWDDTQNAGFSTGTPWFYVNQNYSEINVAQQEADEDSILHFYRKAIALRKELKVVRNGRYREYDPLSSTRYVYARQNKDQRLLVICSYSEKPQKFTPPTGFDLAAGKLVLCNYPSGADNLLRPYETRVYLWELEAKEN